MFVPSAEEMREIDRVTIETFGIPGMVLMENAGRSVADLMRSISGPAVPVVVFCGGGNNGGDGLVIARLLNESGYHVTTLLLCDPGALKGDAATNLQIFQKLDYPLQVVSDTDALTTALQTLPSAAIQVDALFGTGLSKPVDGRFRIAIEHMNSRPGPTVAVDIPSGIGANDGRVMGVAVDAAHTVTFGLPKRGLLLHPGTAYCGQLVVADIGIPKRVIDGSNLHTSWLREREIAQRFGARQPRSHKGTYGHLLVAGSSAGYAGAGLMAARAALRVGAGLVTLAAEQSVRDRIEGLTPELLHRTLFGGEGDDDFASLISGKSAVVLGPGLGQSPVTEKLVLELVSTVQLPLVIDADGLNLLHGKLDLLDSRMAPTILTPHPGEMARLTGRTVAEVQQNRAEIANSFAEKHGTIVVLKGHRTLVAAPDGRLAINTCGNPGMAVGGMGDVLAGILGGLLAQNASKPFEVATSSVFLHGFTGDRVRQQVGERALLPGDVTNTIGKVLQQWESSASTARASDSPQKL